MASSRPHLLTLDDLGANGRRLHVLRFRTLDVATPGNIAVASFFIILILTNGSGSARHIERLDIHDGDIHIIPAGRTFQLVHAGEMQGWVIGFDPTLLHAFGAQLGLDHAGNRTDTQPLPEQSRFVRLRPDTER